MTDLAALAEHYAKHLIVETVTHARGDYDFSDDTEPYDPASILEAHAALVESAPGYDGKTIEVSGILSMIRDDGNEYMVDLRNLKAEDIDTVMVCLAAQFNALYGHAHEVMTTFAGLTRLKKHLAQEEGK